MDTSELKPNDTRVKYETAQIRGKTYGYILGEPEGGQIKETMLLVHGWPDFSFGWRCQVPFFMAKGYRVIVPDTVGYARTDAPQDLRHYTMKSISTDLKELAAKFVGADGQIVLGGHDWGGAIVWRMVQWYPQVIKCVFSICTPFFPPNKQKPDLKAIIESGKLPNFTYRLQLGGPEVEEKIQGPEVLRQFFNAMSGGLTPEGKPGFAATKGVLFENLPEIRKPESVPQDNIDHYVREYMRREAPQMRGPLNYYRTDALNYEEELPLAENNEKIRPPSLLVTALKDIALPPSLAKGMDRYFEDLTVSEVDSGHWAPTHASEVVNTSILSWLDKVLSSSAKASL